jgi:hypothetical protein
MHECIWRSLEYTHEFSSSSTSSKGQTPRFHTPRFMQGIEAKLDEHKRVVAMFQQATKYIIQCTYDKYFA